MQFHILYAGIDYRDFYNDSIINTYIFFYVLPLITKMNMTVNANREQKYILSFKIKKYKSKCVPKLDTTEFKCTKFPNQLYPVYYIVCYIYVLITSVQFKNQQSKYAINTSKQSRNFSGIISDENSQIGIDNHSWKETLRQLCKPVKKA